MGDNYKQTPVNQQADYQQNQNRRGSKKKGVIIATCTAIIAVCIAIAVILIVKPFGTKAGNESHTLKIPSKTTEYSIEIPDVMEITNMPESQEETVRNSGVNISGNVRYSNSDIANDGIYDLQNNDKTLSFEICNLDRYKLDVFPNVGDIPKTADEYRSARFTEKYADKKIHYYDYIDGNYNGYAVISDSTYDNKTLYGEKVIANASDYSDAVALIVWYKYDNDDEYAERIEKIKEIFETFKVAE